MTDEAEREDGYGTYRLLRVVGIGLIATLLGVFLLFFLRRDPSKGKEGAVDEKITAETEQKGELTEGHLKEEVSFTEVKEEEVSRLAEKDKIKELFAEEEGKFVCEYSEISLPSILSSGDLIDVRLSLSDGRDYSVLVSKRAGKFEKNGEKETVWMAMGEEEILAMESALADLKTFKGARLYAVIRRERTSETLRGNYPVGKKSEALIRSYYQKEGKAENEEIVTDKKLNKERKNESAVNGKNDTGLEAGMSYWDGE